MNAPDPVRILSKHAPRWAERAQNVRLLGEWDPKKNAVVGFRRDGRRLVLKVYRHSVRYALQVLKNPISRWGSRAFALRSTAAVRVETEIACGTAFNEAGFATFPIVERTGRTSLLFDLVQGESLRAAVRRLGAGDASRELVERASAELGRRQALALEKRDLRLVHPAPRLQHVWLMQDDGFAYYDFEDRVNPALRIDEALALELQDWLYYVGHADETRDDETLLGAARAVGEDALARLDRYAERRSSARVSGSYRKHAAVHGRVRRLLSR